MNRRHLNRCIALALSATRRDHDNAHLRAVAKHLNKARWALNRGDETRAAYYATLANIDLRLSRA